MGSPCITYIKIHTVCITINGKTILFVSDNSRGDLTQIDQNNDDCKNYIIQILKQIGALFVK